MEKTRKKTGAGRVILRILGLLLALILCAAAFFLLWPLTEHGDRSAVDGSADWMGRLDGSLPISDIALPGTHDSATQYVQLAWFSKCQSLDVGWQLDAGARYLDIRLGADGERLQLMHGFTKCRTSALGGTLYLDKVLRQCYAFLDAHPTEAVVFAVKQEHGDESVAAFEALLNAYVQASPAHWLLTDTIPTLDEARGKLVLMRRYEDEAGLGAAAGIPLLWPNQNGHDDVSLHTAVTDNGSYRLWVQDRYEYDAQDKWAAFTAGIAQNGAAPGDVALHFLSTKGTAAYGHPFGFAKTLNARLAETPSGELSGWIVLDYFSAPLAAHIYETNF